MKLFNFEKDPEYINLQIEMIAMQRWVQETGQRVAILFEGRDTAGKGGGILRFVRYLNPRAYRVVALPKPSEVEQGQWYFQRYINELPNKGEIVFFDRSWYNRAVVEPVMNFCTEQQYEVFMREVVILEKMLVEDGIHIFKLWFSIDLTEQEKRLEERIVNPLKKWKLSTVDIEAQLKWHEFTHYKNEMFARTSWSEAPWVSLKGNNKKKARLEAMRYVLSNLNYTDKGNTGTHLYLDENIVTVIPHTTDNIN
jgi:polyphosphate kinase 2